MNILKFIRKLLEPLYNFLQEIRQKLDLNKVPKQIFDFDNLKDINEIDLSEIFNSKLITEKWNISEKKLRELSIPDGTGGVNPGDRRAIYYLIAKFKPKDVLEIGTHIGASTTCIASALASVDENKFSKITTVDVRDVNSFENKPWINFGMKQSPKEMINALGFNNNVDFIVDTSLNFSKNCSKKFDFIFLDGDHSAKTVYSEISIALKLLRNNGIILLHDFFPKGQPLWSDRKVGKGPYLAVERIKNEGIRTKALPLGKLPWPTKLGSNITSLALYLKE